MNDLFKVIDNLMKDASKKNQQTREFDDTNIRKCAGLLDAGWAISKYESIPNSTALNLVFRRGEEQQIIKMRLSEQIVWMEVLEKREEVKNNVKFI